jgi:hypothetical protein
LEKKFDAERVKWQVVVGLSATVATLATRRVLTTAWHAAGWDPESAEWGSWREALIWGVALGAGMGVARVVAQRVAAAGFERVTGEPPPVEALS